MTGTQADERGVDADWTSCRRCRSLLYRKRLARELEVCPDCGDHAPLRAGARIAQLVDAGSAEPLPEPPTADDPLGFRDTRPYVERLAEARATTGVTEAVTCVRARIDGHPAVLAVMDFAFMAGSLGTAAGERIVRAVDACLADGSPLVLVTASGGARMQEGILSLMQMARTSDALRRMDEAGLLTISVITDPTYAGVAASFATLTDVIVAEPRARLGFTGPRVIEQTIGQRLPEGFQTAEFLLEHGLVDAVRPRSELRATLAALLDLRRPPATGGADRTDGSPAHLVDDPDLLAARDPWEAVTLARHPQRPTTLDYARQLLEGFVELHGDRMAADCAAVVGGLGRLGGRTVVLIGHQKGHDTAELVARDFGIPTPDGYRKAARLMRLAAKLGVPVVTLVDTPGAHPGIEAEEHGQAVAIAENLRLMSGLPVPVVTVVTGEGGSGGALGLAVADRVLSFDSSVYSVISPEGCAAILWRDRTRAPDAAAALRIGAADQLRLGVVDAVIREPEGGVHTDGIEAAERLGAAVRSALDELCSRTGPELVTTRSARFRALGTPENGRARDDR